MAFDQRDEFCMQLLARGLPAEMVMHYASRASSSGRIWGEREPDPEVLGIPLTEPTPENLRYLGTAMEWFDGTGPGQDL